MKIRKIETIIGEQMPGLVFVRVTTDDGVVGYGETYYTPHSVRAYIHEFAAPQLIGKNPLDIEGLWRNLYGLTARFGAKGLEMRALSAIDVALWDILGKVAGLPIYRLLGGACRDRIRVYNTCGGTTYSKGGIPGQGKWDDSTVRDDLTASLTCPDDLAEELLSEGIAGMKFWPFDRFALARGGNYISPEDLAGGIEPLRKIRDRVGSRMEIMIEGHGYWSVPEAIKIARALEDYRPAWIEDMILAHDPGALGQLTAATTIPVLASEYLMTRHDYRPLIESRGADIIMVDPTWAGGFTECRKICSLADTYSLPVALHDCTGPFTLLAGVHLAINAPNAMYQEMVRAFIREVYPDMVTDSVVMEQGHILAPDKPGIGAELHPDFDSRSGVTVAVSQ